MKDQERFITKPCGDCGEDFTVELLPGRRDDLCRRCENKWKAIRERDIHNQAAAYADQQLDLRLRLLRGDDAEKRRILDEWARAKPRSHARIVGLDRL